MEGKPGSGARVYAWHIHFWASLNVHMQSSLLQERVDGIREKSLRMRCPWQEGVKFPPHLRTQWKASGDQQGRHPQDLAEAPPHPLLRPQ